MFIFLLHWGNEREENWLLFLLRKDFFCSLLPKEFFSRNMRQIDHKSNAPGSSETHPGVETSLVKP